MKETDCEKGLNMNFQSETSGQRFTICISFLVKQKKINVLLTAIITKPRKS